MTEDRLITVAIHTYEHALRLKHLLESEGVPVVLHNVNLSQPVVSNEEALLSLCVGRRDEMLYHRLLSNSR
mgnify:CR=1 FL=1